jgi:hypothetical protein
MFDLAIQKENSYDSVDELMAVKVQSTIKCPTEHCTCKIIELPVFIFAIVDAAQRTQQGTCHKMYKKQNIFRQENIKHFLRQTLMQITCNSTTRSGQ